MQQLIAILPNMESQEEHVKRYSNGEVEVEWRAHLCIHSENCWRGLPQVFNPKERPWINVDGTSSEGIVAQVRKCPSGALRIAGEERTYHAKAIIAERSPAEVQLEPGRKYAWCACGRSVSQPFCDATHKKTDLKPVVFGSDKQEGEKAWLCRCKQTSNPPYCDGTHNTLQ